MRESQPFSILLLDLRSEALLQLAPQHFAGGLWESSGSSPDAPELCMPRDSAGTTPAVRPRSRRAGAQLHRRRGIRFSLWGRPNAAARTTAGCASIASPARARTPSSHRLDHVLHAPDQPHQAQRLRVARSRAQPASLVSSRRSGSCPSSSAERCRGGGSGTRRLRPRALDALAHRHANLERRHGKHRSPLREQRQLTPIMASPPSSTMP